jgi:phage tail-like protein
MSGNQPYGNFNFRVEIDGITVTEFSEVSGLGASIDVIEYRTGGDPTTRKLPGRARMDDLVLRRGIDGNRELWDWFKGTLDGQLDRKNGSVILLDAAATEVRRWNFHRAWPRKWEGPALDGDGNEIAIEELVLTHEGIELA